MRKIDLEQGSPQWHEFRKNGIGASECAAVFGKCKYSTPLQLWEKKVYDIETEVNGAMIRGSEMEPVIRQQAEQVLGEKFPPVCGIHDDYDFIRASLDGINADGTVIMEIKYASKANHALASSGYVPEHYKFQVQQQLLVSGAKKALYVSFNDNDLQIVEVLPDLELHQHIINQLSDFWKMVCMQTPPALSDDDLIEVNDEQVLQFVNVKKENDAKIKELEAENKRIIDELVQIGNGTSFKGDGFKFLKVPRKGSVDYKKVPSLAEVDLEQYRKPSTFSWQLRTKK